jgi:hypothetical protein
MAEKMTQQQAYDKMVETNEVLVKVHNETSANVAEIEKLKAELEAAGGPGGTITEQLAGQINATYDRAVAIDSAVADIAPPE